METKTIDKSLPGLLTLSKVPSENEIAYKLDKTVDWVSELLSELNRKDSLIPAERLISSSHLDIDLKIKRNFTKEFGDYLLMTVKLNTEYHTECVRTLMPMKDTLKLEFKCCFLDETFETDEKYVELTEIYMEKDVYELVFYGKKQANIKDAIHEQIYLNKNSYPILNPDSEFIMPTSRKQ
jgi:uncharacterized metal-binding protein YceD (DUF177 family)